MYSKITLRGYVRDRAHHAFYHDPLGISKREADEIINSFKNAFDRVLVKLEYQLND